MRNKIVLWIEHLLTVFETGEKDVDDRLKKLLDAVKAEPDDKTLANLHRDIYDIWYRLAEGSPIGLDPKADIAYAAELMTQPKITETMFENASIALCGAACKDKSTLVITEKADGMIEISGWNHQYFLDEKAYQAASVSEG